MHDITNSLTAYQKNNQNLLAVYTHTCESTLSLKQKLSSLKDSNSVLNETLQKKKLILVASSKYLKDKGKNVLERLNSLENLKNLLEKFGTFSAKCVCLEDHIVSSLSNRLSLMREGLSYSRKERVAREEVKRFLCQKRSEIVLQRKWNRVGKKVSLTLEQCLNLFFSLLKLYAFRSRKKVHCIGRLNESVSILDELLRKRVAIENIFRKRKGLAHIRRVVEEQVAVQDRFKKEIRKCRSIGEKIKKFMDGITKEMRDKMDLEDRCDRRIRRKVEDIFRCRGYKLEFRGEFDEGFIQEFDKVVGEIQRKYEEKDRLLGKATRSILDRRIEELNSYVK